MACVLNSFFPRQGSLKRKPVPIITAAFFVATLSCSRVPNRPAQAPQPSNRTEGPIRSPSGKIYTRTRAGSADHDEQIETPSVARGAPASADDYAGTARKAAKLSVATGPIHTFPNLAAVLASLVPDAQMRAKHISSGADSGRIPQEEMVVTVSAFLYASSRERDNDFHCIVGSDRSLPTHLMNVEVSGLPPSGSPFRATLKSARDQFKAFFTTNQNALPTDGYDKYDPPIPVQIVGSLFFDVDHPLGEVGPVGLKPQTSWEIHPVSDIQFEPASLRP